jgi:integrase
MGITFVPELNYRAGSDGLHLIQIRCSLHRKHRRFSTGVAIEKAYWEAKKHQVRKNHPMSVEYNAIITEHLRRASKAYSKLLALKEEVHLEYVIQEIHGSTEVLFSRFAEESKLAEIKARQKMGTYRRYLTAVTKFLEFAGKNIDVKRIDYTLLKKYEHHLITNLNNSRDTVSANLSVIRAIINEAIKRDIYKDRNPFEQLTLQYTDNTKEKLTAAELKKLMNVELPNIPSVRLARDFFVACFLTEGCRGGDMVAMKKEYLNDGFLIYSQQKTGKKMVVAVTPPLQSIIDRYADSGGVYLFPLLRSRERVDERVINSRLTFINKYLKEACKYAGIFKKITTHCARHTFTDLALAATDGNIYEVQQRLGHKSVKTTEIYSRNRVNSSVNSVMSSILCLIK